MGKNNPDHLAGVGSVSEESRREPVVSGAKGVKKEQRGAASRGPKGFFDGLLEETLAAEEYSADCAPCGATAHWRANEQRFVSPADGFAFQDAIGKELRTLYDDIVAQPIPDRFFSLIRQLDNNVLSSVVAPDGSRENE